MCEIIRKTKRKEVVVYKTAILKENKVYSNFTGQRYEINKKIKRAPNKINTLYYTYGWNINRFSSEWKKRCRFYNKQTDGLTSGFVRLRDLKDSMLSRVSKYPNMCIVRMVLIGNIYKGIYNSSCKEYDVYMSDMIKEIKILNIK